MKSKIAEVGVFSVGLGVILSVLITVLMATSPAQSRPIVLYVIAYTPPIVLMIAGGLVLLLQNKFAIVTSIAMITLTFGLDVLADAFSGSRGGPNPIKLLISGGCIYVVWKNGRQALAEVDQKRVADERAEV